MSRLNKKCIVASVGLHGLLLVVLVVSPALTKAPPQTAAGATAPLMELIRAPKDLPGNPTPVAVPVEPLPPVKQADPEPPVPTPPPPKLVEPPQAKKVEPLKEPEPKLPIARPPTKDGVLPTVKKKTETKQPPKKEITAKAEPKKEPKKDPKKDLAKTKEPEKSKPEPKVDQPPKMKIADTSKPVPRNTDAEKERLARQAEERAAGAKATRAAEELRNGQLARLNGLRSNLSDSIKIDTAGVGGLAFENYGQRVVGIYESAWVDKPQDVTDDSVIVHVSVTIARDGSVKDAHIVRPSGKASVDRSVRQTLENVRRFDPFPSGSTDEERTFKIDFNLKTSKRIG